MRDPKTEDGEEVSEGEKRVRERQGYAEYTLGCSLLEILRSR